MRYVESKISESTAPLHSLSRACIFFLFISENAFVQLLFTQHWAFLGSIGQGKKEGSVWFAPVAGIGSLSSTLAASAVGRMVEVFSLSGVLILSSFIMLMSGASAEYAYIMAEKVRACFIPIITLFTPILICCLAIWCHTKQNGFDPHPESTNKKSSNQQHLSLVKRTEKLFARIPVLKFLCGEVVVCQCLSALVTFLFLRQMKMSVTDDLQRAGWTGNVSCASVILLVVPVA
jgi:ATP/ADP translocase